MKRLITLIFLSFLSFQNIAQTPDSVSAELTRTLEKIAARGFINGFSVAIVNQKGTLYNKGFGYADVQQDKKYTQNSVQNIASISKTLIGIALLKAQELGKLNLDDPVNKYLPFEVSNPYFPDKQITVRQLATHTSSIKDPAAYEKYGYVLREKNNNETKVNRNFRSPDDMIYYDTFLKEILSTNGKWYRKKNFLKVEPGERFEYSNIGAGLAALVIEKATGESFNEFTKKYIFKPLKMSQSGWFHAKINAAERSKLYSTNKAELASFQLVNYPDGGLITSSTDLGKYLTELISGYQGTGKLLTKENYAQLFKPNLTDKNFKERNENIYNDEYNMGIFMGISAQGQVGHTGGDPGVATHLFFNTKTGIGKILIVNTDLEKAGITEFIDIWKTLEEYETALD